MWREKLGEFREDVWCLFPEKDAYLIGLFLVILFLGSGRRANSPEPFLLAVTRGTGRSSKIYKIL